MSSGRGPAATQRADYAKQTQFRVGRLDPGTSCTNKANSRRSRYPHHSSIPPFQHSRPCLIARNKNQFWDGSREGQLLLGKGVMNEDRWFCVCEKQSQLAPAVRRWARTGRAGTTPRPGSIVRNKANRRMAEGTLTAVREDGCEKKDGLCIAETKPI